jgi:two-component system, chemotaxis family, protein-glutamate methylesterase/glutaminase
LKTIDCSGPVVSIIDFSVKGGCCPSVDPRLESFESMYGRKAPGVVLFSMGRVGSEGARCLRDAGDLFFEHHELRSAVFGMPIDISQPRPWLSARMDDW